jgi:hypothetical protein
MRSCHVPKYIVSAHSVFPGWIGFSQWIKRELGDYPPRQILVALGRMSKAEREKHIWFGLYLWEKNRNKSWDKSELRDSLLPTIVWIVTSGETI